MEGNRVRVHNVSSLVIAVAVLAFLISFFFEPQPAVSQSSPIVIFLTSGTSWTVPSDWNSANNTIEVIGGGGGGRNPAGGAGGGGAYSKTSNLGLTPGSTVTIQVGSGGGVGSAGGDTWVSTTGSAPTSVSQGVLAKGGSPGYVSGVNYLGGAGGATASGIGNVKYSGGTGGGGPPR